MANIAVAAVMIPALNARLRNTPKSSSGSFERSWRLVNRTPPMAATTVAPATIAQFCGVWAASLIARTAPVRVRRA